MSRDTEPSNAEWFRELLENIEPADLTTDARVALLDLVRRWFDVHSVDG